MANDLIATDRRLFLAGSGALLAASAASAHPHGAALPVFGKSGNFDLNNPRDRLLARIKVNASLTGERAYIWNMSRHMLCEPGKVPYQILAEMELMTIWIEPPAGEAAPAKIGALFTRIPVDPLTFAPVTSYDNPYTGNTVALENTLFGGSGLPLDPDDPEPNIVFQQNKPHYRMGENITFVNFDPAAGDGPHQPKVDSAMLTANYADLMDPATGVVEAEYQFAAYFPAGAYRWTDVAKDDQAKIFSMKAGRKVGDKSSLPPEFLRTIGQLYPERI